MNCIIYDLLLPKIKDKEVLDFFETLKDTEENVSDPKVSIDDIEKYIKDNNL